MTDAAATRKAAFWVGAVFVLGAALGGAVGYFSAHHAAAANPPLSEPQRRANRVAELTRELTLTPAQAHQLDTILQARHAEAQAVRDQSDAQMEQLRQKTRNEIRGILAPEQKPKFEAFLGRIDAKRKLNPSTPR